MWIQATQIPEDVFKEEWARTKTNSWMDGPLRRTTLSAPLIGQDKKSFEPIGRWQQKENHIKILTDDSTVIITMKKRNSYVCTYIKTLVDTDKWPMDVVCFFSYSVPSVPMTTEQQANKVTLSSWGSTIAQPQHVTAGDIYRGRWGQILNYGVKRWKKSGKLWLRIPLAWNLICSCTGKTGGRAKAGVMFHFNKFVQCVCSCHTPQRQPPEWQKKNLQAYVPNMSLNVLQQRGSLTPSIHPFASMHHGLCSAASLPHRQNLHLSWSLPKVTKFQLCPYTSSITFPSGRHQDFTN